MAKYSNKRETGKGSGIGAGVIGNYDAGERKSTKPRPNFERTESAGVGDGLNARSGFDGEEHGPDYNYMRDPLTGNANERPKPYASDSAKSKGLDFDIC
jgi:hypothetical protein